MPIATLLCVCGKAGLGGSSSSLDSSSSIASSSSTDTSRPSLTGGTWLLSIFEGAFEAAALFAVLQPNQLPPRPILSFTNREDPESFPLAEPDPQKLDAL